MPVFISVEELANKMRKKEDFLLLDVREDWERKICSIRGSVHIPFGNVSDRMKDIPKKKEIVVYCHGGVRSTQIAGFLISKGFSAMSLAGGIDEWAEKMDRKMKRY